MLKASAQDTKSKIVDAAISTLKSEGFAGTSARAIARRGGINQALIFYHFGTLNDLLLAALDKTSTDRMARYKEVLSRASTIDAKIESATLLYREDLDSGHITVLAELIAGGISNADLGSEVVRRMQPWVELADEMLTDIVRDFPIARLVDPKTLAFGIVALYLGVDLLSHLEGDRTKAEALLEMSTLGTSVMKFLLSQ